MRWTWGFILFFTGCIAIPVPRDGTNGVGVAQTAPPAGQIHKQYVGLNQIPPESAVPHIAGLVLFSENTLGYPIKFVSVQLQTESGKILFKTTSDSDGRYSFQEKLKTGRYRVVVVSEKYTGMETVSIGGGKLGQIDISVKSSTGMEIRK